MDIGQFQLKRVNPFQGLVIDADTWKDAHNYHRDQQRLHVLAFHNIGIVSGLEVTANNPADISVNISPGMAIDPDGNVIIMPQKQQYRLQTQEKGIVYLIIQFREIPGKPFQPPEGGQATRILEAFRVQERNHLPAEPYVELARINFDPAQGSVKDAKNPANPAINEINLRFREVALKAAAETISVQPKEILNTPKEVVSPPREIAVQTETLLVGYLVLGEGTKGLHLNGLKNLIKSVNRQSNYLASLEDLNLKKPLSRYNLIYLTGNSKFELTSEQQSALSNFLQGGGIIFGDSCSDTSGGAETKGAREFGLAFNRYASLFNCKLGIVQRGHAILSTEYVFAETPQGCEQAMLLEGGNMIYSGSDYGCAWDGGHPDHSLSREIIRSAFEIGENIISCARKGNKR